jgi:hypothetical protein
LIMLRVLGLSLQLPTALEGVPGRRNEGPG